MEEGVAVSNSIPFVIYGTVNIISIIKGAIIPGHSIFYQSWFITGQHQLINLAVIGCSDAVFDRKECSTITQMNIIYHLTIRSNTRQWIFFFFFFKATLPWVENTQQKQNQSYNSLRIPPLHYLTLGWNGGGIVTNDAQQTWVTAPVCEGNYIKT